MFLTHQTGFGPLFGVEGNFLCLASLSVQVFGMQVKGICLLQTETVKFNVPCGKGKRGKGVGRG